jgi:hypothetical protein
MLLEALHFFKRSLGLNNNIFQILFSEIVIYYRVDATLILLYKNAK